MAPTPWWVPLIQVLRLEKTRWIWGSVFDALVARSSRGADSYRAMVEAIAEWDIALPSVGQ